MKIPSLLRLCAGLTAFALLILPTTAHAQERLDLAELRWPAQTRGPLLLVAPESLNIPKDALAQARSREGVSLTTLAPLISYRIERYGNLSVLGPLSVPALAPDRRSGNMLRSMYRAGSALPLLASLSDEQWTQAASEAGIGKENLTGERQRALWEQMLPPGARFLTTETPAQPQEGPVTLGSEQLAALRLRVSRRLLFLVAGVSSLSTEEIDAAEEEKRTINARINPEPEAMPAPARPGGQVMVPYQRKKTDLDPALLDAPLSLENVETVGALVERIARASGIELYADRRLKVLSVRSVAAPGQSVRAGDALAALIRATGTAVRRVSAGSEAAFVLTLDRTPLAVTTTTVTDALLPILLAQARRQPATPRLPDVWDRLPRREISPSPESVWQRGEEREIRPFAPETLPQPLRGRLETISAGLIGTQQESQRRQVTVQAQALVELVAPFWNATARQAIFPISSFRRGPELPLVTLPSAPKRRILQTPLPGTESEQARLVALAATQGFNGLLVSLSGDTRDDARFASLARLAAERKIALIPALCPLQPAPGDTTLERDLSLTGRSASALSEGRLLGQLTEVLPPLASLFQQITERDFVSPEAAPVQSFARRVAALSVLPGITDIVLLDLTAPGYSKETGGATLPGSFDILWTGGATPSARLASLRKDHFDPTDIGVGVEDGLPAPFSDSSEARRLFRDARLVRRDAFLKRLETALKATGQKSRLWAYPLLETAGAERTEYVSPWQGRLPALKTPTSLRLYEHLSTTLLRSQQRLNGQPADDEPNLTRRWLSKVFEESSSESFVLSFTDLPLKETLVLLEQTIAKK
jgi:hypothetical protein